MTQLAIREDGSASFCGAHLLFGHDLTWLSDMSYHGIGTEASALSASGQLIERLLCFDDVSGSSIFIPSKIAPVLESVTSHANVAMIELLQSWIKEFGDDEAPDLQEQRDELLKQRLSLREE